MSGSVFSATGIAVFAFIGITVVSVTGVAISVAVISVPAIPIAIASGPSVPILRVRILSGVAC